MTTLFPYQQIAVESCVAHLLAHRPTILVAPTGSGKTVMAAEIPRHFQSVLIVAHRREILQQARDRFGPGVQIASVQSLSRADAKLPQNIDLVIIDEAHRSSARTYRQLIAAFPDAALLGLTATPVRTDGQGLAGIFREMVQTPGYRDLLDLDPPVLVPFISFEAPDQELRKLQFMKKAGGDWKTGDLSGLMNKPRLVGNVVSEYKKHALGRKAICFAVGVDHSTALADAFRLAGIRAAHLDGKSSECHRRAKLDALRNGEIDVLCNVNLFTEGWDCPAVDCVIVARPTASLSLHLQAIGRALRASPGKRDAVILDHAGNLQRHGYPDADWDWKLESDKQRSRRELREAELSRPRPTIESLEAELEERRRALQLPTVIFSSEHGDIAFVLGEDKESIWATAQQLAVTFGCTVDNIRQHLVGIYEKEEAIDPALTSRNVDEFRIEGRRIIKRSVKMYNIDAILCVGYGVDGRKATVLRKWFDRLTIYAAA